MKYNPEIHRRRSLRLKGYDYSKAGLYFITICCEGRVCRFGDVGRGGVYPRPDHQSPALENAENLERAGVNPAPTVILNELGQIAYDEWIKLPQRFQNMELDIFQIMPNHIHAIILLNGPALAPAAPIGAIVGAYKSIVSNECLKIFKTRNNTMGNLWQRNYYEHIIRDELSLFNISKYIMNNPGNWLKDDFYDHGNP